MSILEKKTLEEIFNNLISCNFRVPKKENRPPLRQYLMDGDFFIGTTLASTLAKLALKYLDWETNDVRISV